jgi:hypothetical protein
MMRRSLVRAGALATVALLAFTGLASADAALTDGNGDLVGPQNNVHIGTVAPGAVVTVPVAFELRCTTANHVDVGQNVTLSLLQAMAAPGGAVLSVTPGTVGPIPAGWPADGATCPDPQPTLASTTSAQVTLRAPLLPNVGYTYTVGFTRTYAPTGNVDGSAIGVTPSIVIRLDVAENTAPSLVLPADQTVEGDTTGGAVAAFTVSATDAQDDPDPTPTCDVHPGDVLPLGTTTVDCSVTDAGGLSALGSFDITVEDTTDPSIATHDVTATTGDPAGTAVTFDAPTVSDVVDAAPTVGCVPASGSTFAVGTTAVTCTATDASGNAATSTFDVTVTYVPTHVAGATWLEPVGGGGTFAANRGRSVPVKVVLSVDGVTRTSGDARLVVTPCGGGASTTLPLTFGGGRWNAGLDTGPLAGACQTVTATIDGLVAGSFELDLRGAEPMKAKSAKGK